MNKKCFHCNKESVAKGLCKKHYMSKWYVEKISKPKAEYKRKLEKDFPLEIEEKKIKIRKSKGINKKSSMMICEICGKKVYRRSYSQKYCKNCRIY